jgi:hypothetical protein
MVEPIKSQDHSSHGTLPGREIRRVAIHVTLTAKTPFGVCAVHPPFDRDIVHIVMLHAAICPGEVHGHSVAMWSLPATQDRQPGQPLSASQDIT